MTPEVYVSTDVEADGPIPGPHSLLSLGSAAYRADKTLLSTFSANLLPLEGAAGHPDTRAWWAKHPEAWAALQVNRREPAAVVAEYVRWLDELPGPPVFVGYPASYDFLFVYWYLIRVAGRSPFGFAALDIKTLAFAALRDTPFRRCAKKNFPARWFDPLPHNHVALDDAIEQGALFCNVLAEIRK
jgi:hypothetical protein